MKSVFGEKWNGEKWKWGKVENGNGEKWNGEKWKWGNVENGEKWNGEKWNGEKWNGERWNGEKWNGEKWKQPVYSMMGFGRLADLAAFIHVPHVTQIFDPA